LLLVAAGCSIRDLQTPERMERGLVIILPGIEGRSRLNLNLARGLDEGGVKTGIEIFDWGSALPGGMLINLADYERNRRVAEKLKVRILRYRRRYPGRPIHLVGHSAGGGLALMATEALPRDVRLTSVILLAPAVSPKYDLHRALRRTRFGIFNHYSERDRAYLMLGTSLFGTVDRHYGPSAGAVGFERSAFSGPDGEGSASRLHQIRWRPRMRRYGHDGGHTGWTNRRFVSHYLAPLINDLGHMRPPRPSEPFSRRACPARRKPPARLEQVVPPASRLVLEPVVPRVSSPWLGGKHVASRLGRLRAAQ
jgi:pimeloyl-ACP methyl ester carboxylesterase